MPIERVMNLRGGCRLLKKEASERDEVEPRHRLGQPLIIIHQSPKARCLRGISFHHPPPRQQHEAALGLLVLDHFEPDALFGGQLGGPLARVSLIYVSDLDVLLGRLLYLLGEFLHLLAVVLVLAGLTRRASRCPKVSTAACTLEPFLFLCPS